MYQVLLLNDDFTPMEFVVCGVYPRDLAATKVEQVSSYSRQHQHPLQCVMEEA